MKKDDFGLKELGDLLKPIFVRQYEEILNDVSIKPQPVKYVDTILMDGTVYNTGDEVIFKHNGRNLCGVIQEIQEGHNIRFTVQVQDPKSTKGLMGGMIIDHYNVFGSSVVENLTAKRIESNMDFLEGL